VGGVRYQLAFDKLTVLQRGRTWRWLPGGKPPPKKWTELDFDDSGWFERRLDLGWVEPAHATSHGVSTMTTYFRHAFEVEDPDFFRNLLARIKRSDGAIVYLNGREVYRANIPDGRVSDRTPARAIASGIERNVYYPGKLDRSLLRKGRNVLAVEIHRAEKIRDTLTFDLELLANLESTQETPYVQFAERKPRRCPDVRQQSRWFVC
jgi:hypothetical protein